MRACWLNERQRHPEQRTAARILLDRDVPAVDFDRPLRDRQTKTGPSAVARARFIETEETIEDAVAIAGGDARALVGDVHDGPIAVHTNMDVDGRTGRTVLDRVVEEIRDRLAKDETIEGRDRAIGGVDSDSLVALLGKNRERRHDIARELAQVDGLSRESYGSRVSM